MVETGRPALASLKQKVPYPGNPLVLDKPGQWGGKQPLIPSRELTRCHNQAKSRLACTPQNADGEDSGPLCGAHSCLHTGRKLEPRSILIPKAMLSTERLRLQLAFSW